MTLFNAALENVFKNLLSQDKWVTIDGKRLTHLKYTDDIVLISQTSKVIKVMLNELNNKAAKIGLNENLSKLKQYAIRIIK